MEKSRIIGKYCLRALQVVIYACCSFYAFSQSEIDSLKKIINTSAIDSVVTDASTRMGLLLMENEPAEALSYLHQSVQLAQKSKDEKRKAKAFNIAGIAFDYKGDLDSCIYYFNESLALYKQLDDTSGQISVISDFAITYYFRGNYELALRNQFAALNLMKLISDTVSIARTFNNIGLIYRARKDFGNAAKSYKESLVYKRLMKDEQGILNTLLNTGSAYQYQGNYDSAYYFANEALHLAQKINKEDDIMAAKTNIGAALVNLGRWQEANIILFETEKYSLEKKDKKALLTIYESMGDIALNNKNYFNAIASFTKGLDVAKSLGRQEQMMIYYRKLARAYKESGNTTKAYDMIEASRTISDTLLNEENIRQMNELSAIYETAEKEKRIGQLNTERSLKEAEVIQRKKERNYFIIASVLFLALAMLAYKAFTSNKKKKEKLDIQNKIIEKSLQEKEFLMKEIHHRVKNNLQVVSSLLNLQSHYIKDEQALDAVKDSRNRVQSMALIHQNLYQEENLTGIDLKDYISKLCENLFQSYNIHPGKIKLIREIQPLMLDVDNVVPLGLILNELITNSLKYGFPEDQAGTIKISLSEENETLKLNVYDNGAGLPSDFHEKQKASFGYKMINTFMQKLKGEIRTYTEDGTKVEITIRNYKHLADE